MLARIIAESEPFGKDHEVVLETIDALGSVGSDAARCPALVDDARGAGSSAAGKLRALKERGVDALVRDRHAEGRARRSTTLAAHRRPRCCGRSPQQAA